jgi:tetraacyldisaccharide 4'-kinase
MMGGAGKTPTVLMLIELLREWGCDPVVVSRGYGGCLKGPLQVDDGHQHTSLKKDLNFLVVNGHQKWGNGCVFPAGPLREPLEVGLRRADGLFYIQKDTEAFFKEVSCPVFYIRAEFDLPLPRGQKVVGFCGLGYPDRFRDVLSSLEVDMQEFHIFPDHHFYSPKEEGRLLSLKEQLDVELVTTEKDWVKLSPQMRVHVQVVKQHLVAADPEALRDFIMQKISSC